MIAPSYSGSYFTLHFWSLVNDRLLLGLKIEIALDVEYIFFYILSNFRNGREYGLVGSLPQSRFGTILYACGQALTPNSRFLNKR